MGGAGRSGVRAGAGGASRQPPAGAREHQVADVLLNNLDAPGWVFKVILAVLVAGLPITVILSWIFDWTPSGLHRTPHIADATGATLWMDSVFPPAEPLEAARARIRRGPPTR